MADTGGPYPLNASLPRAVLGDGRLSRFERACFIAFRGAVPCRAVPCRAGQGGRMSTSTNARFSGKFASVIQTQIAPPSPTTPDPPARNGPIQPSRRNRFFQQPLLDAGQHSPPSRSGPFAAAAPFGPCSAQPSGRK